MNINSSIHHKTILSSVVFFFLVLWTASHIPFLSADADLTLFSNSSRAPWTDEGLYTGQIRNYINHNRFELLEGDAFLKSPLLSTYLYVPFNIAGTSLEVARIGVIVLVFFSLLIFIKQASIKLVLIASLFCTFSFIPVHQYCHFALAELCSVCMILLATLSFARYMESSKKKKLVLCYLLLLLAALFKLQFIYVLSIPTLALLLLGKQNTVRNYVRALATSSMYLVAVALLLIFVWYLPFATEFEWLAKQQGKFDWNQFSYALLKRNIESYFLSPPYAIFSCSFLLALFIGLLELHRKNMSLLLKSMFVFLLAWFIVEMHKLPFVNLPLRYLISTYCVMGLTIAVTFAHIICTHKRFGIKLFFLLLMANLLFENVKAYYKTYNNRTFVISNMNCYIKKHATKEDVIIGAWAPALTWESKNIAIPIWKNFLQTNQPIDRFKPSLVIGEWDEEDSDGAYTKLGIDLNKCSSTVQNIKIIFWDIKLYWLNPQKKCR